MKPVEKAAVGKEKAKEPKTLVLSEAGPFGGRIDVHTLEVAWHASNPVSSNGERTA